MRICLSCLILCALPIAGAQALEANFGVISNVQYCTGGGKPLLMDVFIPRDRNTAPTAAVLWIHGGGWDHGDKSGNSIAQLLANAGCYLRANASKYGIDPDWIGVAGGSAGGHLAELVATADQSAGLEGDGGWQNVSSKVQAAVSYFGPSDLTVSAKQFPRATDQVVIKFIRGTETEKPALYRKASPLFYEAKEDPPLLLVHGERDEGVPFDQSVRMFESYQQAGLPVEFIAVENCGHDFQQIGLNALSPFWKPFIKEPSTSSSTTWLRRRQSPNGVRLVSYNG